MPIHRPGLGASSFRRKLLAYAATWTQAIHRTRFAMPRVRVLTVTAGAERVTHLRAACAELSAGRGMFLFANEAAVLSTDDLLAMPWERPGQLGTALLLD